MSDFQEPREASMRRYIFLLVLACSMTSQADVFKCLSPAGETVFSDVPCDEGEKFQKVRPSESVSDPVAAKRELERQRAYAERVAAENEAARQSKEGVSSLPENVSPSPSWPAETPLSPSTSASSPPAPAARGIPQLPRTAPPVSR
ncbi:MAG TPA: DUF4124 domain-containing protein [Azonexus sp.]|nr:DUF4124 domain-containing protein [Azonexus sp.]